MGAYSASKAAPNAFVEVLIEESRGCGVNIMLACPPLLKQATETSNPKAIRDSIEKGRLADPGVMIDDVEKTFKRCRDTIAERRS